MLFEIFRITSLSDCFKQLRRCYVQKSSHEDVILPVPCTRATSIIDLVLFCGKLHNLSDANPEKASAGSSDTVRPLKRHKCLAVIPAVNALPRLDRSWCSSQWLVQGAMRTHMHAVTRRRYAHNKHMHTLQCKTEKSNYASAHTQLIRSSSRCVARPVMARVCNETI